DADSVRSGDHIAGFKHGSLPAEYQSAWRACSIDWLLFSYLFSFQNRRILILHNQPAVTTLHKHESADVPLRSMFNSVRHGERANDEGNGSDGHSRRCKSDVHTLNPVGCSLEEGLMNRTYLFHGFITAPSASAVRVNMSPIIRGEIDGTGKTFIESFVERLDC